MDKTLILEISSDEEVGFDDSSTADNFDWVSKLLDDSDDLNCGKNNGVVDLDDVVVVGEVVADPKRGKISVPKSWNFVDDDDDCVVLDCDPDKEVDEEMKGCDVDSDDLMIVGEKGQERENVFMSGRNATGPPNNCSWYYPFDGVSELRVNAV